MYNSPISARHPQEMSREEMHAALDRQLDEEKGAAENVSGFGHGNGSTSSMESHPLFDISKTNSHKRAADVSSITVIAPSRRSFTLLITMPSLFIDLAPVIDFYNQNYDGSYGEILQTSPEIS